MYTKSRSRSSYFFSYLITKLWMFMQNHIFIRIIKKDETWI